MNLQKTTTVAALTLLSAGVLGASTTAFAGEKGDTYDSNAIVKFKADTKPTPPTNPDKPNTDEPVSPWDPTTPDKGNKPNPGTQGPLSLDYASSIDFGENLITDKDMTYYAEPQFFFTAEGTKDEASATANYVQISDNRGTNGGWTLRVKQNGQFKSSSLHDTLTGAQVKFAKGTPMVNKGRTDVLAPTAYGFTLDPTSGAEVLVMDAAENHGMGTWVNKFGTLEDVTIDGATVKKNKAITLDVPGTTLKDAAEYRTTLTWNLTDVPAADVPNPGE